MSEITLKTMLYDELNTEEQKIFIENFQCFLDNDSEKDHVIDLDFAFKWLGLSRKDVGKRLLEKHCVVDLDYIEITENLLHSKVEQNVNIDNRGGHNKEIIMMTPNTFKELCILANTDKDNYLYQYI